MFFWEGGREGGREGGGGRIFINILTKFLKKNWIILFLDDDDEMADDSPGSAGAPPRDS